MLNVGLAALISRAILSIPTQAWRSANCSGVGCFSGRFSGPNPHKLTTGPTVTSNAPSVTLFKRIASANTLAKSAEISIGVFT